MEAIISHKRRKPVPFKVEGLSVTGREIVDAMLAKNCTFESIAHALKNKTGERVGTSSLWRYRNEKWLQPETKIEAVSRVHQMLGRIEVLLIEIRDALGALGARQLRVIPGGQDPAKERPISEDDRGW